LDCTWSGTHELTIDGVVDPYNSGDWNDVCYCFSGGCPYDDATETVVTYENEVLECDVTLPSFPAWPEDRGEEWGGFESGQGESCSAFRDWSEGLISKYERKIKWRLAHDPTGTCYLKVWLQKRFTPEGGGADTITALTPYEWTGTGNPCFAEALLPPDDAANRIASSPTEEGVPAADGTTTIEIVKWSCVSGYTPPDDGSANGYPVPA
jgi:hypothetical protein